MIALQNIFFQTVSVPGSSSKRLSLPVLHHGMSLNDISMRKSPAHRTRSSTEFGSSKSPPYRSEQHLSRRSRRMSLVSKSSCSGSGRGRGTVMCKLEMVMLSSSKSTDGLRKPQASFKSYGRHPLEQRFQRLKFSWQSSLLCCHWEKQALHIVTFLPPTSNASEGAQQ